MVNSNIGNPFFLIARLITIKWFDARTAVDDLQLNYIQSATLTGKAESNVKLVITVFGLLFIFVYR